MQPDDNTYLSRDEAARQAEARLLEFALYLVAVEPGDVLTPAMADRCADMPCQIFRSVVRASGSAFGVPEYFSHLNRIYAALRAEHSGRAVLRNRIYLGPAFREGE